MTPAQRAILFLLSVAGQMSTGAIWLAYQGDWNSFMGNVRWLWGESLIENSPDGWSITAAGREALA